MVKHLIFIFVFGVTLCSYGSPASNDLESIKNDLMEKAKAGELSDEEYNDFVRYGLCKPLKDNFLEDRERGWAYGEFCSKEKLTRNYKERQKREKIKKEQAKNKKEPEEKLIGITGTGGEIVSFKIDEKKIKDDRYLDSLDSKKFRYLIQTLMDKASYNPTPENVENYLYVQDYMARKALKVARVWQQVILSNPKLGGFGRFKRSSWESKVYAKEMEEDRKKFFKQLNEKIGEKVGIYIFVSGECKYCHMEMEAVRNLEADYGVEVMAVSKDFCPKEFMNCIVRPEAFERFNISVTPTIVLLVAENEKPKFQTIAVGLTSEDVLINRIVYYYKYLKTGKHIDDRTLIWGTK